MTKCKILKDFPFSRDGFTTEKAVKGKDVDIPVNLVRGLEEDGFLSFDEREMKVIDGTPEEKESSSVGIPEGWRDLPWIQNQAGDLTLRALARDVSGESIKNKADAVAAIELEIENRS